jgi:methylamine dehydrogenase heavy chain
MAPSSERGSSRRTVLVLVAPPGAADLAPEPLGEVETLPAPGPHWVWASDAVTERIGLVDLESGELRGVVDGGWGLTVGLFAADGSLFVPETHYSRGSRGRRTDVVTFYDRTRLTPEDEVLIPAKRAFNALPVGNAALSDDDRFAAVFNMTPATSISIVDLERRRFAGEVETPGCSLVYGAGARRFLMLCAAGRALLIELDDQGNAIRKIRSDAFFDPDSDPVTEKAVRRGDTWYFASFEGLVHEVDVSGPVPAFREPWSLVSDAERDEDWRIGGRQLLAVHRTTGRLYALMHQGPPDSHKEGGSEAWVYDLETRERVQRIALRNPGLTYLGVPMEFGQDWIWPFNRLYDWVLSAVPLGTSCIAVTQDDAPLLVTGSEFSGSLALYDARSGEFLRRTATGNMTTLALSAPYGGPRR